MEGVAELIRRQNEPYHTTLSKETIADVAKTGLGVNVLKTVIDFEQFVAQGATTSEAFNRLRSRPDSYCPVVVKALGEIGIVEHVIRHVNIEDLLEGMILDENLLTIKGELLLARGNEINAAVRERLVCIAADRSRVKEPVRVICPS
jgi:hypothetical protein